MMLAVTADRLPCERNQAMQRAFLGLSVALLAYLAIPAKLIAEDAAENVKGGDVGGEKREPDKTIVELRERRLKQARLLQDEIATRFGGTHIEIIAGDPIVVSGTVRDSDQVVKILKTVEFRAIQMGLLSLSDYSAGGGVVNNVIAGRAPFSTVALRIMMFRFDRKAAQMQIARSDSPISGKARAFLCSLVDLNDRNSMVVVPAIKLPDFDDCLKTLQRVGVVNGIAQSLNDTHIQRKFWIEKDIYNGDNSDELANTYVDSTGGVRATFCLKEYNGNRIKLDATIDAAFPGEEQKPADPARAVYVTRGVAVAGTLSLGDALVIRCGSQDSVYAGATDGKLKHNDNWFVLILPELSVADRPAAHNATSKEQPRAPISTEPRFIPHSPRFDIPPRMPKAPVLCLA
jgi:hypothetical protein